MLHSGIAERTVNIANCLVGLLLGGRGMSNVPGCALFSGFAGSPLADVSAMGSVMIPLIKKEGHHANDAVNVTILSGILSGVFTATESVATVSVGEVVRSIWPFYGAPVATLLPVSCGPAFSLWLPNMFG